MTHVHTLLHSSSQKKPDRAVEKANIGIYRLKHSIKCYLHCKQKLVQSFFFSPKPYNSNISVKLDKQNKAVQLSLPGITGDTAIQMGWYKTLFM